ncbi:unnamed protein product [Darwinula stevensoni]|uniref:Uncharacterized protein n=1 Tax=Darwinula stevensoni TaxID=69355 RepID=A0A7R8X827_9CRUS|nr:unnamed protein product [Darwinula stevensoni]CAG0887501.1 unnamed protein product [Darwinula stevensoni]
MTVLARGTLVWARGTLVWARGTLVWARGTLAWARGTSGSSVLYVRGLRKAEAGHHLAVVIPFRERFSDLIVFIPHMNKFLKKQDINHTFILVNQVDSYRFNRASLINVGVIHAKGLADYIAMHDVDLLPLNDQLSYEYPKGGPMHLAAPGLHPKYDYETFIGGILLITVNDFLKVKGMSNQYWGWGMEDDEFNARLGEAGLKVQRPTGIETGKLNTFQHIHHGPRDSWVCYDQYEVTRKRDRVTGIDDVQYKMQSVTNLTVETIPVVVLNVELRCDASHTPWCDCSKTTKKPPGRKRDPSEDRADVIAPLIRKWTAMDKEGRVTPHIPERQNEVSTLLQLLGERMQHLPPAIIITGPPSSGKSFVMRGVLESTGDAFVFINCIECYTVKLLFQLIILRITDVLGEKCADEYKYDNSMDFIHALRSILQGAQRRIILVVRIEVNTSCNIGKTETNHLRRIAFEILNVANFLTNYVETREGIEGVGSATEHPLGFCKYRKGVKKLRRVRAGAKVRGTDLVLTRAEYLCDMPPLVLPLIMRLQDFTSANLSVVFLIRTSCEKFKSPHSFPFPIQISFPQYSKDDLVSILMQDCPPGVEQHFYKNFLNLLLSVFYPACRNLSELRFLARNNFSKYQEPVVAGDVSANDLRRLWRHIEPQLKRAMQSLFLREVSSAQWEKLQEAGAVSSRRLHLELPLYSKYLLLAAYLASYNPSKTDKRFFMKHHGKQRKMLKSTKKEKAKSHLIGPKPFTLDRLLAIFYSIIDEKVIPSSNIMCQVTSLVTLGLLARMRTEDPINAPKYKCLLSFQLAKQIARTVEFDLLSYLYEFV